MYAILWINNYVYFAIWFSEPLYSTDDLKKKYKSQKFIKVMIQYDKMDNQQKEIVAKVQAIIAVVSDNEFLATMHVLLSTT